MTITKILIFKLNNDQVDGMERVFKELLATTSIYRDRDPNDTLVPFKYWSRKGPWQITDTYRDSWDTFMSCRVTILNDASTSSILVLNEHGEVVNEELGLRPTVKVFDREQLKLWNLYDQMGKLMDELQLTKEKLLEEQLRPPTQGGSAYQSASDHFNSLSKRLKC